MKTTTIMVQDLTPHMVYLKDDGEPMFILEVGENVEDGGPTQTTFFMLAGSLRTIERATHHLVPHSQKFDVVEAREAILDEAATLDERIGRNEKILEALSESDTIARGPREAELEQDRSQRDWLVDCASKCGVRFANG